MLINPKGSLLLHFWHYATFSEKNTKSLKKTIFLFPVLSSMKGPVTSSSPCFGQKLFRAFPKAEDTEGSRPLFQFFPALCYFFLENSFSFKGSPFNFFDILQQTGLSTSPKGLFLQSLQFKKNLRFLSLRYSADFRRSRLVPPLWRTATIHVGICVFRNEGKNQSWHEV